MSDLLERIDLRYHFVAKKLRQHVITESGCWEYQGYRKDGGYGSFKIYVRNFHPQKRAVLAHRVSWAFYNGEDPGEMFVCHRCDNPCCINPDHLFLGTPLANTRDMLEKGRGGVFAGEKNPRSKLTTEIVCEIVGHIVTGLGNKQIAELYDISHAQVSLIRLGKSWGEYTKSLGYKPDEHRVFSRKAA